MFVCMYVVYHRALTSIPGNLEVMCVKWQGYIVKLLTVLNS